MMVDVVECNYDISPVLSTNEHVVKLDFDNNIIHLLFHYVKQIDHEEILNHNDTLDNHLIQYEDLKTNNKRKTSKIRDLLKNIHGIFSSHCFNCCCCSVRR
mgnify:CR=1 FL=1